MAPNARFRSNVRVVYAWLGSLVVLGIAPLMALRLIDRGTTLTRAAAVILGVGAMLPWMWVVFWIIRRSDEFVRRLHLLAFGFAFGGVLVLLVALNWLVRAEFIYPPDLMIVLFGCLVLWFTALVGVKRYFERSR
jgi:hypothetical protein